MTCCHTVREFIDEFCDSACESVIIIETDNHIQHEFDGKDIDTIPETLLNSIIKDHSLCYIPERFSHEVWIFI